MNKKSAYILIGILLIIAGIILLTKKSDVQTNQIIKIGAPLVLSGDSAAYGEAAKNAITIAALAYNARPEVVSGKVPHIEVVYEPTRDSDPKAAVSAYKKLTSIDHVDALVGPLLQIEISALTPLIKQDGIPTIAIAPLAFDQRANTTNPLAFWPDPTFESAKMADYVFDQGVRSVAVLTTKDPWETEVAKGFTEQFKKRGGVITDMESVLQDSPQG